MNIEEALEEFNFFNEGDYITRNMSEAKDIVLLDYKKEKEKNENIDYYCRKELAFKRRLEKDNRIPDEFNQGRFYICENIRKIINGGTSNDR